MDLSHIATSRYTTKKFKAGKRIPDELFAHIRALLRCSPSSVNSQPWHFVIASTPEGRQRISKGAFVSNERKVLDASHVILFCAKTHIDDAYLQHILDTEQADGRFVDPAFRDSVRQGRDMYANLHRYELKDAQHWMEKQVYLNLGTVLLGAAMLGIDATPIEGMDPKILNQEFSLIEKGFTAIAMVALGYRDDSDFNASLPKSRLPEQEIITDLP